jgi:hypothetical protein
LHRTARLLLNDGRAVTDPNADADIVDLQPHEIAAPEFAVDREVEQGEVAGSALVALGADRRKLVPKLTDDAAP